MPMPSQASVQDPFALLVLFQSWNSFRETSIQNPKTTTTNQALIGISTDATAKTLFTNSKNNCVESSEQRNRSQRFTRRQSNPTALGNESQAEAWCNLERP